MRIVHEDMRNWEAPEKADIIISELLGSFGDNELSPECLDGAQRLLKVHSFYQILHPLFVYLMLGLRYKHPLFL